MQIQWKKLIPCVLIPLAVGGMAALFLGDSMALFASLNQPPLSPPGWLFPIVWTVLYILMGWASYLVLTAHGMPDTIRTAVTLYGIQLVVNFVWPLLFFRGQVFQFSLFWIILLLILVLGTMVMFFRLRKAAGWLLFPYLLWTCFAVYLNAGVYLLN